MKRIRYLTPSEILTLLLLFAVVAAFLFIDRQTHAQIVRISELRAVLIARELITPFGKGETLGLIFLMLLAAGFGFRNIRLKSAGFYLLGSYITSGLLALILKVTVTRPRPYIPPEKLGQFGDSYYQSFPSGDAAAAMAAALAVGYVFPKARIWLVSAAGIVALFRVLRLAHWPSDALSGLLVGVIGYWILLRVSVVYRMRRRKSTTTIA